jgi:hypothetical protein
MSKIKFTSSMAWITYVLVMIFAYVLIIRFPNLPFLGFASQFTIGFIGFLTNRHFQRKQEYEEGRINFNAGPESIGEKHD